MTLQTAPTKLVEHAVYLSVAAPPQSSAESLYAEGRSILESFYPDSQSIGAKAATAYEMEKVHLHMKAGLPSIMQSAAVPGLSRTAPIAAVSAGRVD